MINPFDVTKDFLKDPEGKKKTVPGYFFYIGMTVFFYGVWYIILKRAFSKDFK